MLFVQPNKNVGGQFSFQGNDNVTYKMYRQVRISSLFSYLINLNLRVNRGSNIMKRNKQKSVIVSIENKKHYLGVIRFFSCAENNRQFISIFLCTLLVITV